MAAGRASSYHFSFWSLLLVLLFAFNAYAQVQPYPFKQFPLPKDLPAIKFIYENKSDFIWLGTEEGLYRFDGASYSLCTGKDGDNPSREPVSCVYEDRDEMLWIGTKTGLYKYYSRRNEFFKYTLADDLFPRYLSQENDSTFLVHCRLGIYLFYPRTSKWIPLNVGIDGTAIYSVIRGENDQLWIGTDSIVREYNLITKDHIDHPLVVPDLNATGEKIFVSNMFLDSRACLWINTWYKGVFQLNTDTHQITYFDTLATHGNRRLLDINVPAFAEDDDGNVWLASEHTGIDIWHPESNSFTYVMQGTSDGYGLTGSDLLIMSDDEKNIWIKSNTTLHYLPRQSASPEIKSDPSIHLDDVLAMSFLSSDYILAGTFFGLFGIDLGSHLVDPLNDVLQLPKVHNAEFQAVYDVLNFDDQTIWLTSPQGLRSMQWKQNDDGRPHILCDKFYPSKQGFLPSRLSCFGDSLMLVRGRMNSSTFAICDLNSGRYTYFDLPDSMRINYTLAYAEDTVLMAVRNKGLYYYILSLQKPAFIPWEFNEEPMVVHNPVFYKLVRLDDGTYVLCTENYGLFLFDPAVKRFKHIDTSPVANSSKVFDVEEDHRHNLWVYTTNHLLYYDRETGLITKLNLSYMFNGYIPHMFSDDRRRLFGTYAGALYQVDGDQLFYKAEKPKFFLQSIRARDRQLDWTSDATIRLPYTDNFLTLDVLAPDYDHPEGITYWYRIPELSDHWENLGNRSSVSFGSLSPGKYHIAMKAANNVGMWSDEIHIPEIWIRAPFWRAWWFYSVIAVIVFSVLYYVNRLGRLKRKGELNLRNQIARDLHDDIGSTLSGIKIFSSIASGMSGENTELTGLLQQIHDKSSVMMQSMSDIVWSINPAHDSLNDMMIRLKQYMSEILESRNVEVHYKAGFDLRSIKVSLAHRKELFLALKEMINNAAKYSACHNFYFDINKKGTGIVIDVKDDGIGIDANTVRYGNGLRNIETRITNIGGKIQRHSAPGQGVAYKVHINP